jgi:hypothetical protein
MSVVYLYVEKNRRIHQQIWKMVNNYPAKEAFGELINNYMFMRSKNETISENS